MGHRHGAHKVYASHGVHEGAHKGIACPRLAPGTLAKDVVCTMVRTRLDNFGAHKGVRHGVRNGAHKALAVKGILAKDFFIYIQGRRCKDIHRNSKGIQRVINLSPPPTPHSPPPGNFREIS